MNVQEYLKNNRVPFKAVTHRPTYSATELAKTFNRMSHEVAKTVLLVGKEQDYLVVLQADHAIDINELKGFLDDRKLRFANEEECADRFSDCEVGAVPPFGSLYGMETIMDTGLSGKDKMIFEGNEHREAIVINLGDYKMLEKPQITSFTKIYS